MAQKKIEIPPPKSEVQKNYLSALKNEKTHDGKAPDSVVAEDQQAQIEAGKILQQIMAQTPEEPKISNLVSPEKENSMSQTEKSKGIWNWLKVDVDNFVKTLADKIKKFGKNAWYYMSGSFFLDRGSKPT